MILGRGSSDRQPPQTTQHRHTDPPLFFSSVVGRHLLACYISSPYHLVHIHIILSSPFLLLLSQDSKQNDATTHDHFFDVLATQTTAHLDVGDDPWNCANGDSRSSGNIDD
jgi:hypothetical protein